MLYKMVVIANMCITSAVVAHEEKRMMAARCQGVGAERAVVTVVV